jgi:hypothetical protein
MKLDRKVDTETDHRVPSILKVRGQGDYKCCHRSKLPVISYIFPSVVLILKLN